MKLIFPLLTAMSFSLTITPLMMRLAPKLGMVDLPDPRKVHSAPVPRVGGIGIVVGSLVSILLWVPVDNTIAAYLFGSSVLFVFGAWDDCRELGHYTKFIGQFIAAGAVVYWGDVWVVSFPFVASELPEYFGKPFTIVAIVGMINAINHSDGLDGLAGGEALLSLTCIAYLAYIAEGSVVTMTAMAVIGGLFGFLRFNSFPARVFMGDSGSQFLGFTLGVLAVQLTQQVSQSLSMALPALILGLPIIDILAVFAQRVYHGMNWFRASKNHIHHRLLQLGYHHYQAVIFIYSIQALFVVSAIFLRNESDLLVLSLYAGVCTLVFAFLIVAERSRTLAGTQRAESNFASIIKTVKAHTLVADLPTLIVSAAPPLYFVLGSLSVNHVNADIGVVAIVLAIILALVFHWRNRALSKALMRVASYATAPFLIYPMQQNAAGLGPVSLNIEIGYFGLLAVAIAAAIRYGHDNEFRTTPTDYLIVFLVAAFGFLQNSAVEQIDLGFVVVRIVILFYGVELVLNARNTRWTDLLHVSVIAALAILGWKSLLIS